MGLLPSHLSLPGGGWEALANMPSYFDDGCTSQLTSISLDGLVMGPFGDMANYRKPPGTPELIFESGIEYCIQLCMKAIGDLSGSLTLYADGIIIGATPVYGIAEGWKTVDIIWTSTGNFSNLPIANNTPATLASATILFDDVCISVLDPTTNPLCQADFSYQVLDCGEVCFMQDLCGEVTFFSWNFTGPGLPSVGLGSIDVNPCFTFPQSGTYTVDLIINCSDGTQVTETKMIDITQPDPPLIACPIDIFLSETVGPGVPCELEYMIPNITSIDGSLVICMLDGNPVTSGQIVFLIPGIHTVTCSAINECGAADECVYIITVECDEESCEGPCYNFNENGTSANWIRANSQGNNPPQLTAVNLAMRGPGDFYLDGIDISGSTRIYNETDYSGDWTNYDDCCFCFDYKYVDDANTPTTARPQLTIYQGPESAPTLRATYISNFILTDNDPWKTVCTPLSACTAGQLPSNADGYWIMNIGSGCADWNTLISSVTGIRFPLDYNSNPSEKHGYDNTCWEPCPTNPCDSFMVMVDTLIQQIPCIDPSLITGNPCPAVYDPVCGCNGLTYGNACEAREAGIGFIIPGECNGSNTPEVNGCCYALDIVLKSVSVSAIGIKALNAGVIFNTAMINDPAFTFTVDPSGREIIMNPTSGSTFGPGLFNDLIKFCLGVDSTLAPPTQFIEISYYDQNGEEIEVLCRKSVELGCDPPPGVDPCVLTETADPECQDGYYDIDITVSNVSTTPPFTAHQVVFTSCDPNILFRPDGTVLPPNGSIGVSLMPPMGPSDPPQTLPVDIVPLSPILAPTQFCFETTIWNNDMCCTSPDKVCVTLDPCCNPCDSSYLTEVTYQSPSNSTISIKPGAIMDDAYLNGCQVGGFWTNSTSLITGAAWGGLSDGCFSDAYLNFPLDDLCPDAIITNAELKLFADPLSFGHVNTTSLTSPCVDVKRVTSSWSETTISLTPPSTSSTNQVGLPLPLSPFQDFSVDVTGLVQDMMANPGGSFGFVLDASCPLDLQYIFASGEHTNPALWPELVITYDLSLCPPMDTACCHTLDIEVGCADDYFTKLELELITPGVVIGSHSTGTSSPSDWSNPVTTNQRIVWQHVAGTIPLGTYNNLINFCLDDIDPGEDPQELTLKWYTQGQNGMDSIACIDTLRYQCEPPVSDSCLAIIDIIPKNNLCDTCFVEPFCNQWLLDEVINHTANTCLNPTGSVKVETGTWLGDPVFIITTDLGWPHTFVERVHSCQGVELQNCHDYIAAFECDPDAGIDVATDIVGKTIIWQCGDPIPNAPATCTISSIPNSIDYCLTIKNVSNHTASQLLIQALNSGVIIWPSPYTFVTPLPSGGITTIDINISGAINPGDLIKFSIRLHDHLSGDDWCCFESDTVCVQIPPCPPDPDCCDVTEEEFCQLFDQVAMPVINIENCEICWDLSPLDSCDVLYWQVDNQPWTSAGSGQLCQVWQDNEAHDVCLRIERWPGGHIGVGESCMVKDSCMKITIPCDPCDDILDCDDLSVSAMSSQGSLDTCCYDITIENNFCDVYFKGIKVSLQTPASISSVITYPGWVINQLDNYTAEIYPSTSGLLALGQHIPFSICNTSTSDYVITVSWLHQLPDGSCVEECQSELELKSCEKDFNCYEFVKDSIDCTTNTYCFKIKNTSYPAFDLYSVHLYNLTGGLVLSPSGLINIPGAPLASGITSDWICVTYSGVNPGDRVCYQLSAHNQPVGTPPTQCCTDTLETCFEIPDCPGDICSLCHDGSLAGPNLIKNGDFSNGYIGGWYSAYNLQIGGLTGTNTYSIRNSGSLFNTQWSAIDHTISDPMGKFLTINGPSPNIAYGVPVTVQPNTDYVFCMWVNNLVHTSTRSNPIIQVWIGGTLVEAGYSLPKFPDTWQLITANYNSGSASAVNIQVLDIDNIQYNDWAIDDVSFRECESVVSECCDDFDAFCDIVDIGFQVNIDNCIVQVDAPQFDTCHWFGTAGPDWGDGSATLPAITPAVGAGPWTHTYSQPGTYNICITVYEGDDVDNFCWDKQMCTTVEVDCPCDTTDMCDNLDLGLDPDLSNTDECCFIGWYENDLCEDLFKGVKIEVSLPATIAQVLALNGWVLNQINPMEAEIYPASGTVPLGSEDIFRICNENDSSPLIVTMSWLIEDEDGNCIEVCPVEIEEDCSENPGGCLTIVQDSTDCDNDVYCFKVVNLTNPSITIRSLEFIWISPTGASLSPNPISINPLMTGDTSDWICVNYDALGGNQMCFLIVGHEADLPAGDPVTWCCVDSTKYYIDDDGCPSDDCCDDFDAFCDLVDLGFQVTIDECMVLVDAPQFDTCHWFGTAGPDWGDGSVTLPAITPAVGAGPWTHTYDQSGTYDICITVYEGNDENDFCWDKQMCTTIEVDCPPLDNCCLDYEYFCDLVNIGFEMSVDSSVLTVMTTQFDICHWFTTGEPDWGDGSLPIPGPISAADTVTWLHTYDSTGMYNICIEVFEGNTSGEVCWSKKICKMLWIICDHVPLDTSGVGNPCGPSSLSIPTGFTPNNDGMNDVLKIIGPTQCSPIDITVFNRWGQIVWEQADYDNTWNGHSENGEELPDGTYYIIVDFHRVVEQRTSYQQYAGFIDLRRQ